MICIYHSRDLDGFASGAIVKKRYPEAKLIGFDYGQKLPMEEIPKDEHVIMIDVSLPMDEMLALAKHTGYNFTWIDHHISAIKEYENFSKDKDTFLVPVLQNGIAACEIGWDYLFQQMPVPTAIKLLGKYDTWRKEDAWEWDNAILPFQFGMRQICTSPETFPMPLLDSYEPVTDNPVYGIIRSGKTIIQYNNTQNALLCKRGSFEYNFAGQRAICLNVNGASSISFQSVYDEDKHDIMMPFFFDGTKWIFSLYTTKDSVDCSAIAKLNGGGGHLKAAGFQKEKISEVFSDQ